MEKSRIITGIYNKMVMEGFRYFLIDGDLFGWSSDLIGVNENGEIWEALVVDTRHKLAYVNGSKQNKYKKCRHFSDIRLPNYSSIVCPYNMIKSDEVPDYSGLMYVVGSTRLSSDKNVKVVKCPQRLTDELMGDVEWDWIFRQSQKQYIKAMMT